MKDLFKSEIGDWQPWQFYMIQALRSEEEFKLRHFVVKSRLRLENLAQKELTKPRSSFIFSEDAYANL